MWLMSSIAPISTTRWPCAGSRPVVSVSRMISRMSVIRISHERRHNITNLGKGMLGRFRRIHNEIDPGALFFVGHLVGDEGLEFLVGHARTLHDARFLNFRRRRYHDDAIDIAVASGLEQKRDVENRKPRSLPAAMVEKILLRFAHQRMNDRFESLE